MSRPLHSQQQPSPWDCSTIPMLQLPTTACSREPASLSRVHMAVARSVWFSFHLGCHRSAVFTFSLKCFFLWLRQLSQCGDRIPVSVPPPAKGRSSLTHSCFPPISFILPSFAWFYTFFSIGQVLLSALSWCSACTSMLTIYPWCIHGDRCTPHACTPPPSFSTPWL